MTMNIILTNSKSCQSLAYKDGCYYMQFKPNGKFIEIPVFTEEEAWDFFEDNLQN